MALPELSLSPAPLARPTGPVARVRTMVALRFLVMRNTYARHPWQLVGAIFAALYGLGMLGLAIAGLTALGRVDPELARTALILGGSALVLGWIIGPIVTSGMDRTLEPAKLMVYPMTLGTQQTGIAVASLLGIPGLITLLVSAATALTWIGSPAAVLVAVLLAPVAAVTCVLACQLVITALSRVASGRRFREAMWVFVLVLLMLAGPLLAGVGAGFAAFGERLPAIAEGLGWTPLGAVWSVPAEIAGGAWGLAGAKIAVALASVAVLFFAWRPLFRSVLGSANEGSRTTVRTGTGWFARFPDSPRGAVAARALTYWLRDPRYLQSLLVVVVLPIALGFFAFTSQAPIMLTGSTVMVAMLLSLSIYSDISFDGTAFTTHVSRGVRGIDDRLGRVWACALIALPAALLVAVVTTALVGRWDQLPTLIGLTAAAALGGLGVSSVSSALFVMPVAQAGENPFASKPGAGMISMVSMLLSYGALALLCVPTIVLTILAGTTLVPLYAWLTLLVGLATGALWLFLGVRFGARIFDRRAPELLAGVTAQG